MKNKFNLGDKVIFLWSGKIKKNTITAMKIENSSVVYTVFGNQYDEDDLFNTPEELVNNLLEKYKATSSK